MRKSEGLLEQLVEQLEVEIVSGLVLLVLEILDEHSSCEGNGELRLQVLSFSRSLEQQPEAAVRLVH